MFYIFFLPLNHQCLRIARLMFCLPRLLLAPGWSSGRYALQILQRSLAFVVEIKNSCAVITDLNRMRLCGPAYVVKSLFIGSKKGNHALFLM